MQAHFSLMKAGQPGSEGDTQLHRPEGDTIEYVLLRQLPDPPQ